MLFKKNQPDSVLPRVSIVNRFKKTLGKTNDRFYRYSPRVRSLLFIMSFAFVGVAVLAINHAEDLYGSILTKADELVVSYEMPMAHIYDEKDFSHGSPPVMLLYGNGLMLCSAHDMSRIDPDMSPLTHLKQRHLSKTDINDLYEKVRSLGFDSLLERKLPAVTYAPAYGETSVVKLITSAGERRLSLFPGEKSDQYTAITQYLESECSKAKEDFNPDDVVLESIKLAEPADSSALSTPDLPIPKTEKDNEFHSSRLTGAAAKKIKTQITAGNKVYKAADGKKVMVRLLPKIPEIRQQKRFVKVSSSGAIAHAANLRQVRFLYVFARDQAAPSATQTQGFYELAESLPTYYTTQVGKSFTSMGTSIVQSAKTVAENQVCPDTSCYYTDAKTGATTAAPSLAIYKNLQTEYKSTGISTVVMYGWAAERCIGWGGPTDYYDQYANNLSFEYGFASLTAPSCTSVSNPTNFNTIHKIGAHETGHSFGLGHTHDASLMGDGSYTTTLTGYNLPLDPGQAALLAGYSPYFNGSTVTPTDPSPVVSGTTFISVAPNRLLETRTGLGTYDNKYAGIGRLAAGSYTTLQVGGRAGIPTNALAAALNVTVVNPSANGYMVVYPCGTSPTTSSVNYNASVNVSNMVISKLDASGNVCIFVNNATDLVIDVNGAFPANSTTSYTNVTPSRLLETRPGLYTVDGTSNGGGTLPAGSITRVPVGGRVGIPSNASAVSLNVTVVNPQANGYMVVYPCDIPVPPTSSVNYKQGANISNAVVSKLASGYVCVYVNNATDLVIDVNGAFNDVTAFKSVAPARLLETRGGYGTTDGKFNGIGRLSAGQVVTLQVAGRGNVPVDALATALNVTIINPDANGYATVYPCGIAIPSTSNVNYSTGDTISIAVLSKIGSGNVCIYVNNATDLIVDVNGAFTAADTQQSALAVSDVDSTTSPGLPTTCPAGYSGTYPNCLPPQTATGTVTSANCAVVTGTARDADWPAGGLQIDIRIDSSYTSNPRPPDGTVYTDANGNWSWTMPNTAPYKRSYARPIYFDVLGKNSSGVNDTWVAGSNTGGLTFGPCQASTCSAVQVSLDNGISYGSNIGYNGTANVPGGTAFKVKMSMVNTAPLAGGTTWNTGSASQQVHVGTDGSNTRNDFRPLFGDFRTTDNSPATVLPGQTGYFVWGITAPNTDASQFKNYTMRFQNVQEWVEWFSTTGAIGTGNCQFNINVVPPSKCTGAMLYADANYLGASQSLVAGSYDTAQLSIGNDTISSARVPTGCKLTLFQNGGYGGATQVLTKDWAGGLSDPWNDVTSSIRVEETAAIVSTTPVTCATGGAKLYHDSGFGGKTQTLSNGKYDTTNLKTVGNDAISSVRVASGCKVILYQNGAFSGATKVLTGDWSAPTGDPWNDITSSVEVKDFATTVVISPEMLVHGDFEQEGLNGTAWSATYPSANNGGSVTYGVQSKLGQAHDGTRYMEINSVPAGSSLYQRVATTAGKQLPGDMFRFTAWVRSPSCVAASAYFTLWSAPSNTNSYISITADCTWRQYSTIFTVTKTGETSLSPTLSINASGVNYDVDSASLVKVSYVE